MYQYHEKVQPQWMLMFYLDSPKHLLAHFDTSLDPEYITILEFNKRYKKLKKQLTM